MPRDWDELVERPADSGARHSTTGGPHAHRPPAITLMASAWADLVGMLAVCTGALVAILMLGERPALPAFGWAAALGIVWWVFAAAALVVVRQGTPGMLLAGVSFSEPVVPRRVAWVLAAALVGVATLGLSGIIGSNRSLLRLASASDIVDGIA